MKIKNRECLCSHGNIEGREQILEILEAGMQAADPYYNTASMIKITSDRKLHIGDPAFVPLGSPKQIMIFIRLVLILNVYLYLEQEKEYIVLLRQLKTRWGTI